MLQVVVFKCAPAPGGRVSLYRVHAMSVAHIKAFAKDEHGTILVFWAMSLAVMLGFVALSFDFGRIASTKSELQAFADHVALAAAGELDGQDDAITRAQAAAADMITDRQTFGAGGQTLDVIDYTLTFLSALPDDDTEALTDITTDPVDALYVQATVAPRNVDTPFADALFGLRGGVAPEANVGATAVAGFTQYACDITPLMFCLPSPGYKADENVGDLIRLRSGGSGAAWGPGDFGFLDPDKEEVDPTGPCAGLSGNRLDACLIGAERSITRCFAQRGVDTEPGQKVGIEDAIFNVRFDIYKATMNGRRNDPNYRPAPNVIKGIVPRSGGACIGNSARVSPDTMGLPRDDCFASGSCARFGDGNWSAGRTAYVATNYDGAGPSVPAGATRYEYYLAEIAAAGGPGSRAAILADRAETGRASCAPAASPDPERRIVIAAAIDCTAHPVSGRTTNVPVEEFFRLFLTEPVGQDASSPPRLDLWVEVVGSAQGNGGSGGNGGIVHDVVQLFR